MNQDEFQTVVLNALKEQGTFNQKFSSFIDKQEGFNQRQEKFNQKVDNFIQTSDIFFERVDNFIETTTPFLNHVRDFMNRQDAFNDKLLVDVENQIIDKMDLVSDNCQVYTDKKLEKHEINFRHEPVAI